MKMWWNIIHCDICQFHCNGNVLAEALIVVEYHWYHWYKRRGVRSMDINTRVWVRQGTVTKFYTYMCARARRDQIAEEEESRTCSMHKGDGKSWSESRKEGCLTQCDAWGWFVWLRIVKRYWDHCQEPSCSMKGRNCFHRLSKHRYKVW
jgi:hypothetical protein